MEKICVAVRMRPPVTNHHQDSTLSPSLTTTLGFSWNISNNNNSISLHKSSGSPYSGHSFSFDHVFDQTCPNSRVYELLTKDIIHAAVEGFNGTVFAYGQTSSGKTFTMNGSEKEPGVIHMAIKDVFDLIQSNNEREFLIRVSYMEIYNEEINDLLVVHNQKLPIHESLERGVFVAGLREEIVSNAEQVHKLLEAGEVNRHFGETNMNVRSSRSHTIFRMVIESKSKEIDPSTGFSSSDAIRVSVLNLVDLAGSERIAKTGADGVRLKEGKHINKSLMVLGNVINKLSEGAKQRGHIPYRDSKLTRILQSALGGNAKTSIICTVAPEEVHVEETKGTLQFATRAKRVTNCAQVNEILTDAALLKRQKLEIEELRKKLEGSQSEILEQEMLKLRNDLLKYELEREKLALELEEERKLQRQRDQHIKEKQMKIDNLSNLMNLSDSDQKSNCQRNDLFRQDISQRSISSQRSWQEEALSTPCSRVPHKSFVVSRSNYSTVSDFDASPFPDLSNNVADEDAWVKLNKGFVADLDSLHMTPSFKGRSLSTDGKSPCFSKEQYEQEMLNLKQQMQLVIKERDEIEKCHKEQVLLNSQLTTEIEEHKKQAKLSREIPQMLCESVSTCKETYMDILSVMKSSVADENSFAKCLLSGMCDIGENLFSTLETHCSMAADGGGSLSRDTNLLQEECKVLCEKLNKSVALLASSGAISAEDSIRPVTCEFKGLEYGGDTVDLKENLSDVLSKIKEQYTCLEKNLDPRNQILEDINGRYLDLEKDFLSVKGERDSLLDQVSRSTQRLTSVSEQQELLLEKYNAEVKKRKDVEEQYACLEKDLDPRNQILEDINGRYLDLEKVILSVKDERDSLLDQVCRSTQRLTSVSEQQELLLVKYNAEVKKRKDLEEGMKQFQAAFASRQRSLASFHGDFKSRIDGLRSRNPVEC